MRLAKSRIKRTTEGVGLKVRAILHVTGPHLRQKNIPKLCVQCNGSHYLAIITNPLVVSIPVWPDDYNPCPWCGDHRLGLRRVLCHVCWLCLVHGLLGLQMAQPEIVFTLLIPELNLN